MHGGVSICGQPGIGKSLFNITFATFLTKAPIGKSFCLYYLLIRRLLRGLPIVLQVAQKEILLFLESGTYVIPADYSLQFLPNGTWALVDSEHSVDAPAASLTRPHSPSFIVQATSSQPDHTKWHKYKTGRMFYMRPWDWDEILFAHAL
ncbi:hypothetical protein BOTBODRAFT_233638 [Botryobasidium botryosum FD-172 SS1]|uniref:Uncharacterized protein n=1 Tax=Botryobasidium botryosum (strain FD-172 SS1) TaxID=930990 RepID=A0A067LX31_BOTB1|nr:hypothetical protein BOTBODRAFT_233638 [Botryobasidium botryosum FD-172 SS1]